MGSECKHSVSAGEIRKSFDVNSLHKSFRRDQQLNRPKDASVMRPVAGTPSGYHVVVECVIHTHCDRVGFPPAEQMSDVKRERRVSLAHMFSSQFAIDPDCGRMEHRLKFDSRRGILPFTCSIEGSPIPGNTAIIGEGGVNLPSERHVHPAPVTDGIISCEPTLLHANVRRVCPEPPWAAEAHRLWCGQVRCFLDRLEDSRAHGARSQDTGLRQKFSTRMHVKGSASDYDDLPVDQTFWRCVKRNQAGQCKHLIGCNTTCLR